MSNKRSDLFREYARVIDMCDGSSVKPFECVKCGGRTMMVDPGLDTFNDYTFAVAIVEDKPVFMGDKLYGQDSGKEYIIDAAVWGLQSLTWTPPAQDPYAELKQAQNDGKRVLYMHLGHPQLHHPKAFDFSLPASSYKIVDDDVSRIVDTCLDTIGRVRFTVTKSGLDGKISVELL